MICVLYFCQSRYSRKKQPLSKAHTRASLFPEVTLSLTSRRMALLTLSIVMYIYLCIYVYLYTSRCIVDVLEECVCVYVRVYVCVRTRKEIEIMSSRQT